MSALRQDTRRPREMEFIRGVARRRIIGDKGGRPRRLRRQPLDCYDTDWARHMFIRGRATAADFREQMEELADAPLD